MRKAVEEFVCWCAAVQVSLLLTVMVAYPLDRAAAYYHLNPNGLPWVCMPLFVALPVPLRTLFKKRKSPRRSG